MLAIDLHLRENGPKTVWLPAFLDFLSRIRINSKEATEPVPIVPYGAQAMALEATCDALDADVHRVNLPKARQLGISTILFALDIFWLHVHPGLRGALIMDTGDNKVAARETITQMLNSLPRGYRVGVEKHNKSALILKNGSQLQYMSAGKGKNPSLGRSRDLNFVHASEVSSWGDPKALDTLLSALADVNPNRLYIFESTSLGFNLWYDIIEGDGATTGALRDPTQRVRFLGWWAKETYRYERGTEAFGRFWNMHPRLTNEEAEAHAKILEKYGADVQPEQWAWRRWKATQMSTASLAEEFPNTLEDSWVATGSTFFNGVAVAKDIVFLTPNVRPKRYTVTLGKTFVETKVEAAPATAKEDEIHLLVWEEPHPNGKYVCGIDTAEGGGGKADRTVISIWRCYADKLIQVAEYATAVPTSQQAAWVMAYLMACYRDCMCNLEINGSGAQVMAEVRYLKQMVRMGSLRNYLVAIGQGDVLDHMRWFLYHRVDTSGSGWAYNWRTDAKNKVTALNRVRDEYNREQLLIRSVPMLREMATVRQVAKKIEASSGKKDDRVMAGALACYAWTEWVRPQMMAEGRTLAVEKKREEQANALMQGRPAMQTVIDGIVANYLARAEKERKLAIMRKMLEAA